jgi:cell division protein FtsL
MLSGVNTRAFNNQAPPLAIRQQVSLPGEELRLVKLDRKVVITFFVVCSLFLSVSQLVHWKSEQQRRIQMDVQNSYHALHEENIALRASRAGLMSEKRIARIAEAQLQLAVPTRGQEHLL